MFKLLVICALIGFAAAGNDESYAEILKLISDVRPDGFESALETSNGISQSASGDEHGNIHGQFSWISPEGEHVAISYVADEYGYQPQGEVLPVPPPIPVEIQRALEYIASHPSHE